MSSIIDQISKRANVSKCTVYRVLKGQNKESWASAKGRANEIREIAMELGYRPNAAARSVREGVFKQIACVTTRLNGKHSRSLVGYLDAAADALLEKGYLMVLENFLLEVGTGEFKKPQRLFSENSVDGVLAIISSGYCPKEIESSLDRLNLPVVWINHKTAKNSCCVLSAESESIRKLVDHYSSLGHKKIAYLCPEYSHYSVSSRILQLREACRSRNMELVIISSAERPYIRNIVSELFDRHKDVTGVICYHKSLLDILLFEALKRGIRIPHDLSVSHFMFPVERDVTEEFQMTGIELPHHQMIQRGTELLFDMINNKTRKNGIFEVPASFIPGETTCKVNHINHIN
jgi:LacI family transcriptional regulator